MKCFIKMSFIKVNQDELLDGFCRGCLGKYNDPNDLLHYTEKNRRLFIYSTGIQVKRNDTFTFQICKDCFMNMKASCRFKKQCRTSDRRFKMFLKMKEFGDGPDLVTFLKYSEDNLKFSSLCGHSTPTNQKIRDDDNESTCTSIRNFMTDILQDEDMPDTEASIIREVIEEEADLLDDSLDSHWLLDDCIDNDSRLDFSFSPFATPRSVNNDDINIPNKQNDPYLRCKNNHAKRVLQQLPTTYTDEDNANNTENKSTSQNSFASKSVQEGIDEELGIKYTDDDSITELIDQNQFILNQASLNAIEFDSEVSKSKFPLTEKDIAVKSIINQTFGSKSENICSENVPTENLVPIKTVDLSGYETEFTIRTNKSKNTPTDIAVKSITLNPFEKEAETSIYKGPQKETVTSINLHEFGIEPDNDTISIVDNTVIKSKAYKSRKELPISEIDLAVQSISQPDSDRNRNTMSMSIANHEACDETNYDQNRVIVSRKETDLAVKSINVEMKTPESEVNYGKGNYVVNSLPIKIEEDLEQNHETDPLLDTLLEDNELKQEAIVVDTVDKNLEAALKDESYQNISLVDLLVSPVYSQSNAIPAGISTPTINNILFGEKLEDSNDSNPDSCNKNKEDSEIDVLEEFFKEGVKDFEGNLYNTELPLDLKYDLQTSTCKMCNKKFTSLKALKIHLTKMHFIRFPKKKQELKPKVCNHCGKVVNDERNFQKHINTHIKLEKQITCDLCKQTFAECHYKNHLKTHNITTDNNEITEVRRYLCNVCGKSFKTSGHLAVHRRRHSTVYSHTCPTCGKGFHSSSDLQKHNKTLHTGERPYECPYCQQRFVAKYYLATHIKKHTDKRFECDYCGKRFLTKNTIIHHIHTSRYCKKKRDRALENTKRPKVKIWPFQCTNCLMKFAKKFTLVKHLNQTVCGKDYSSDEDTNSELGFSYENDAQQSVPSNENFVH